MKALVLIVAFLFSLVLVLTSALAWYLLSEPASVPFLSGFWFPVLVALGVLSFAVALNPIYWKLVKSSLAMPVACCVGVIFLVCAFLTPSGRYFAGSLLGGESSRGYGFDLISSAAEADQPNAIFATARFTIRDDYNGLIDAGAREAIRAFERASELGEVRASVTLARLYARNDSLRSVDQFRVYYCRAFDQAAAAGKPLVSIVGDTDLDSLAWDLGVTAERGHQEVRQSVCQRS